MTEVGTGYMGRVQRHFTSCRNGWRKTKTHFELKLAGEVKGSKKAFGKYVIRRRMDRPVALWGKGTNDMSHGKGWLLCTFFTTQIAISL